MADNQPSKITSPLFNHTTFGGYNREQVDAHMELVAKEFEQNRLTIAALTSERDQLRNDWNVVRNDVESQAQVFRSELSISRADADSYRIRMEKSEAELGELRHRLETLENDLSSARAEKESYQALAERYASDEAEMRDILRAASRTAEELRANARREADATIRAAEERAMRLDEESRKRLEATERDYERLRKEFEDFLASARDVAHSFIRKVDETRVPRLMI